MRYLKHTAILVFVLAVFCLFGASCTYGTDTQAEHNCTKCHKMTNEDALDSLKAVVPDAKIIDVRPAPVKGLWEVALETRGQKWIIYLDSGKKFFLSGDLVDLKTKSSLTRERMYALNKVDFSQIPLEDAILMGDKSAKYKVIVFDDPE